MVRCKLCLVLTSVIFLQIAFTAADFGIFDVTTILRPPQNGQEGRLEVHTRTNALDLTTNFTDHHDPAAIFYPPNFNCNIQNTTNSGCDDWDFVNWTLSSFDYYDPMLIGSTTVGSYYCFNDSETGALNSRYHWPENATRMYLSFTPHDVAKDDFYVGFCDHVGLAADRRHYCNGLKITFAPFEGFLYRAESFWLVPRRDEYYECTNDEVRFNVMLDSDLLVAPEFTWGSNNETYTIILERDGDTGCIWVPNAPKQCFVQSDGILMISTNFTEGIGLRITPPVLELSEARGVAVSPEFVGRNLSTVCISVRYFLDENLSADVKLSAVDRNNYVVAESSEFKIAGSENANTRRFTMYLPDNLERATWKLKIDVSSLGQFVIRSINGCIPSDGNIYYVPLLPRDEDNIQNISADDPDFDVQLLPLNLRWKVPDYGYDVDQEYSTAVSNLPKKVLNTTSAAPAFLFCSANYAECQRTLNIYTTSGCYNGGISYRGGCKCLPGFRGPYCESACPPDRFGADCRGHCSVTDHSGCKGKQLAAPGEKFKCARGFTGPSCLTECGGDFYGPDCRLRCGKCKSGNCDRFSGHCRSPCLQGYRLALCQDKFDFNDDPPIVTQVGYDFVEGFIKFMYNRNLFVGYPYYKIQYKKKEDTSWKSVLVQKQDLTNFTDSFRLTSLTPTTQYELRVVLVHHSGESYEGPELPTTEILTLCNHCDITDLEVMPHDRHMKLTWRIVEKQFNCPRERLEVEIHMAPLAKPLIYKIPPNVSAYTVDSILPRSRGAVRLRSITKLGEIKYFPFKDFYRPVLEHITNLSVAERAPRAIVLQWSTEEKLEEAKFHIHYQVCGRRYRCRPLICAHTICPSGRLDVTGSRASIQNLEPFSQYIFSVDNHTLAVMTKADWPSEAPVHHPTPVFSEQSTSAWVQWLDPPCQGIHGIQKGFRIELRQGNSIINTTEEYHSHSIGFPNLRPDTPYEAHVFVVNNQGWNPSKYLRIAFKTKSA